ncbi:FxsA family protein [Ornithinimicrobium kibberense]|uniref:FxsA family protein n=2 Tax=Ornithinimicrobium kibberense TaxID=282060 RepID=A0ABV5V4J5_9MICO|nr:FxsA family protein [Ornithinimicrobium kibberense]
MTTRPTPPRRRGALRWLLIGMLALPLVELVVLVLVGQQIGFWWTLALVVGVGLVGAWLGRRESGRTYRALQEAVRSGRPPADEVTDAILVMIGAFLLVLPGFVSDLLGLAAVLPFTRPTARRLFQAAVARQADRVTAGMVGGPGAAGTSWGSPTRTRRGGGEVIEGEVVEETPPPGTTAPGRPRLEE